MLFKIICIQRNILNVVCGRLRTSTLFRTNCLWEMCPQLFESLIACCQYICRTIGTVTINEMQWHAVSVLLFIHLNMQNIEMVKKKCYLDSLLMQNASCSTVMNFSGAETGISMCKEDIFALCRSKFKQPSIFQCWKMMYNTNTFLIFCQKKIYMTRFYGLDQHWRHRNIQTPYEGLSARLQ